MPVTVAAAAPLSESEHAKQLRRAIVASTIGTTIEWYDFFLYSTVTGLVFAKLFFPNSDPFIGTLNAFGIYAVGFVARPIGAAIFGHFGDRIGRKSTLVATLMLMGIATFLVGLVPSYASIGIWGAILLTVLRFIQGVGVGGEWGGSVLLAMEWARTDHNRGFIAAWPQFGVPAGLFLANLAVLGFGGGLSPESFLAWGWRVPFLISIVLVGIGLWIRLGILETPVFQRLAREERLVQAPIGEVLRLQWPQVLLTALARMGEQAPFYIFTAFIFSYGTGTLGLSRNLLLTAVLGAAVVSFFTNPLAGHLSDRFGRRRVYIIGAVATGIYAFIYFGVLDLRSTGLAVLMIVLSLIPHDTMYGPLAALTAESFTPRLRYSGASLGYQFASVIAGGPAPLIAASLFRWTGSAYAIAFYMAGCCAISVIATSLLPRRGAGVNIDAEYDAVPQSIA